MDFDLPSPQGPTSEATILAYVAPMLARLTLIRDALAAGAPPMAHRSLALSSIPKGNDKPSVNDGAEPSVYGASIAPAYTQAIDRMTRWAVRQLETALKISNDDAQHLVDGHVTYNVMSLMADEKIALLNELDDGTSAS